MDFTMPVKLAMLWPKCSRVSELLGDRGYVHTVPDSETDRLRKCTG